MDSGFTNDPDVALTGILSVALLGTLVMCGGLVVGGVVEGSWFSIVSGLLLLAYLSWMVWQAGQVVRRSLKDVRPEEASGA